MLNEYSLKYPGEVLPIELDFTDLLPAGETLTGAPTVTATALGRITGAAALTVASVALNATNTGVTCRISGGTAKEDYRIEGLCNDTAGNKHGVQGVMQVRNMGE